MNGSRVAVAVSANDFNVEVIAGGIPVEVRKGTADTVEAVGGVEIGAFDSHDDTKYANVINKI